MPKVYGHKPCKSLVEVVAKSDFDKHMHGIITNGGKVEGVTAPMLLITDSAGNIIASRVFDGDVTVNGTITAQMVIGAVYA